jgi:predicted TIM-barrel fold metal-dependent hydrolase
LEFSKEGTVMIIDVHYHLRTNRVGLTPESIEWRLGWFSKLSTKMGVKLSVEDIREETVESMVDPGGEKLLRWMDDVGIDVVAVCAVDDINGPYAAEDDITGWNKDLADISNSNPGKVISFAGVDPRRVNAPQLLKKCLEEFGMKGVKYHPDLGYYPDSEESYAVLEVAADFGVPLLTHTGQLSPPYRNKYSHPIHLDNLAVDFPELKVIAAHMNNLQWMDWAVLAAMKDHLYGDLAMWQFPADANFDRFCRILRELIDTTGVDKILFATDAPGFESIMKSDRWIEILKGLPENAPSGVLFTSEEIEAILGGNARQVLNL